MIFFLQFSCLEHFYSFLDKGVLVGVPNDLPARRLRMHHHFDDLVKCYQSSRIDEIIGPCESLPPEREVSFFVG